MNLKDDLLLGSASTGSAKFAFTGMMGNNPQASFSGNFIVMPWTNGANENGGNVGIGTTTPGGNLDVRGQAIISAAVDTLNPSYDTLLVGQRPAADSYGSVRISPQNSAFRGYKLEVYDNNTTANYFDIYDVTNSADRLHINSSGNIGIGTANPLGQLDVRENLGTTIPAASFSGQTTFAALVTNNNGVGDLFTASASGWTRFTITNTGGIALGGNLGTGLCLTGGTTAGWSACAGANYWNLVNGNGVTNGGYITPINSTADFLIGGQSTASADFAVLNLNSGTPTATVAGNLIVMPGTSGANELGGMVGIGTTQPQALLNAASASNAALLLQSDTVRTSNSYNSYIKFVKTTQAGVNITDLIGTVGNAGNGPEDFNTYTGTLQNALLIGTTNAYALQFGTNSNVYGTFDTIGRFGLGTNTPTAYLDVTGTASVGGVLKFRSGTAQVQSTADQNLILGGDTTGNITLKAFNGLTANGITFTGYNTCTLKTDGNGNITCGTDFNSPNPNWWNELNGALSPVNLKDDLLLGNSATTSAAFAFTGLMGTQTQASISGNLIVMPNNGFGGQAAIGYTNAGTATLAVNGNVGIGTTTPGRLLDVAGSASINNNLLASLNGGAYYGRTRVSENQWALGNVGATWTSLDSNNRTYESVAMSSDGKYQTAVVLATLTVREFTALPIMVPPGHLWMAIAGIILALPCLPMESTRQH